MDRSEAQGIGVSGRPPTGVLPSRAAAIELCRAALKDRRGPALLTGAAGVGKTWLWKQLAAEGPEGGRWLGIDLTPLTVSAEFFGRIGHALGLPGPSSAEDARRALADELREQADDGRRWVLVVDEAQNASVPLLEEIRILTNRLGQPDGFAGLLLVGQTTLTRRMETRPLDALETRLAARVHLRSLDADEARTLLVHLIPGRTWDWPEVEVLHREAAGNPQRLLRLAALLPPTRRPGAPARPAPIPDPGPAPPPGAAPALVPAQPPLRVEDGLIEVGWEPDAEPAPSASPATSPDRAEGDGATEVIDDHYAALQAWHEWARNQDRHPSAGAPGTPGGSEGIDPNHLAGAPPALASGPHVWAEGQQGFAPYSQLFSRLRQPKDAE
jgi:type II secretory pathway predicted ATPase ExeA